jgi:hypothetical protein
MHERATLPAFEDNEDTWLPERPHKDNGEPPDFSSKQDSRDCPQCKSTQTVPRHTARRIGGAVGAAAGATSAIALALSGAETGAAIGVLAGPIGAICGSLAGAILAGLVAGATGCATGAAFGDALDHKVLNNWQCLACRRTFTVRPD